MLRLLFSTGRARHEAVEPSIVHDCEEAGICSVITTTTCAPRVVSKFGTKVGGFGEADERQVRAEFSADLVEAIRDHQIL